MSTTLRQGGLPAATEPAVSDDHPEASRLNGLFRNALACARAGDQAGAEEALRRIVESAPESHPAWYVLGSLALRRGEAECAIDALGRAVALRPDRPEYQTAAGDAYRAAEYLAEAERHYRAALTSAPSAPQALAGLGMVLVSQGQVDEGVEQLHACVRQLPRHPVAHMNLGNGLLAAGRPEDAVRAYDRALALDPSSARAHGNRAAALLAAGRAGEAAAAASRAVRADPSHVNGHLNLGYAMAAAGRREEAARAFRAVLDLAPGHPAATFFLAASIQGTPPPAPPRDYVREVFDRQAGAFDRHLTEQLQYQAPAVLSHLARASGVATGLRVVDLGCGTGLMGAAVRDLADRLVGIDLSPRMLEQAARRGVYDELCAGDVVEALSRGDARYELFVAADVFIYLGDLAPALAASRRAAAPDARLVFSVESDAAEGYALLPSGRYAHAPNYVVDAAAAAGWALVLEQAFDIRLEGGRGVPGHGYAMVAV